MSDLTAKQKLAQFALVVRDYDEAIQYYCEVLGFELVEDTVLSPEKRWVVVAPDRDEGARILLAKAVGERQTSRVGDQTGGRVFLFLHTDDFDASYGRLQNHGVQFVRPAVVEEWGRVAVFEDLYGNLWDLIQPS